MADDTIYRQAALEVLNRLAREKFSLRDEFQYYLNALIDAEDEIKALPSAQPDTSRIENILYRKSAEEQYNFLWWLMQDYGMQFTDTRSAVIEWLRGERNG